MQLRNVIAGISITALLVVGLAVTQLLKYRQAEEVVGLNEIEMVQLEEPLEPEDFEEPEPEPLEQPPPLPPAFEDLCPVVDMQSLQLPSADVPVPIDFESDLLSMEPLVVAQAKATAKPKPKVKRRPSKPRPTRPKLKKPLRLGDLDAMPTKVKTGRLRWPSTSRSKVLHAKLKVEINETGRLRLIQVVSIGDEKLRSQIPSFVRFTRFTPPTKDGKPVKAEFIWPISIKK